MPLTPIVGIGLRVETASFNIFILLHKSLLSICSLEIAGATLPVMFCLVHCNITVRVLFGA